MLFNVIMFHFVFCWRHFFELENLENNVIDYSISL